MNTMQTENPQCLCVLAKASSIDGLCLSQKAQAIPSLDSEHPHHAVVRVRSAAINPSDVKACLGIMPKAVFPRTPGRDFAGTVVAGPAAWLGREVWGSGGDVGITRDGSHGAYLQLPVAALKSKPTSITMDEAGAVGVPFVTAYEGLHRAGFFERMNASTATPTPTVAVMGANGKVGQAAVQLVAHAGAQVIAVQRHAQLVGHACKAVDVIDARSGDVAARILELTNGRGADIVFNTVDSIYFEAGNAALAKRGVHIFIIASKGQTVPFDVFTFYRSMHTFVGIDTLALDVAQSCQHLDAMRSGFDDGALKPFPVAAHQAFALADAHAAYRRVLAGESERLVLRP